MENSTVHRFPANCVEFIPDVAHASAYAIVSRHTPAGAVFSMANKNRNNRRLGCMGYLRKMYASHVRFSGRLVSMG